MSMRRQVCGAVVLAWLRGAAIGAEDSLDTTWQSHSCRRASAVGVASDATCVLLLLLLLLRPLICSLGGR
jgi:hypothetical protein